MVFNLYLNVARPHARRRFNATDISRRREESNVSYPPPLSPLLILLPLPTFVTRGVCARDAKYLFIIALIVVARVWRGAPLPAIKFRTEVYFAVSSANQLSEVFVV